MPSKDVTKGFHSGQAAVSERTRQTSDNVAAIVISVRIFPIGRIGFGSIPEWYGVMNESLASLFSMAMNE
ncbi:hypothetical protein [Chlorobium sp.]|uniref:hypothetical protein n=1 Tax=Chlorobium sp. TaxID=1095 RepID=UPI003C4FF498